MEQSSWFLNPFKGFRWISPMMKRSLPAENQTSAPIVAVKTDRAQNSGRETLKILLIGSSSGVKSIIHTLHQLGFAELGEWSPPQPTQNTGETISILQRPATTDCAGWRLVRLSLLLQQLAIQD